jgi:hypothetical protein
VNLKAEPQPSSTLVHPFHRNIGERWQIVTLTAVCAGTLPYMDIAIGTAQTDLSAKGQHLLATEQMPTF